MNRSLLILAVAIALASPGLAQGDFTLIPIAPVSSLQVETSAALQPDGSYLASPGELVRMLVVSTRPAAIRLTAAYDDEGVGEVPRGEQNELASTILMPGSALSIAGRVPKEAKGRTVLVAIDSWDEAGRLETKTIRFRIDGAPAAEG